MNSLRFYGKIVPLPYENLDSSVYDGVFAGRMYHR
jgi:hypothetical protein